MSDRWNVARATLYEKFGSWDRFLDTGSWGIIYLHKNTLSHHSLATNPSTTNVKIMRERLIVRHQYLLKTRAAELEPKHFFVRSEPEPSKSDGSATLLKTE